MRQVLGNFLVFESFKTPEVKIRSFLTPIPQRRRAEDIRRYSPGQPWYTASGLDKAAS